MTKLENQIRRCVDQCKRHQVGTCEHMCLTHVPTGGGNATLRCFFFPDEQQRSGTTNLDRFWCSDVLVLEKIGGSLQWLKLGPLRCSWTCPSCNEGVVFAVLLICSSYLSFLAAFPLLPAAATVS